MSKLLLKIHRVLGTILSLFFFLWFSTGFVMLFRSFPSVSQGEALKALAPLDAVLIDSTAWQSLYRQVDSLPVQLQSLEIKALPQAKGLVLSYRSDGEHHAVRTDGVQGYSYEELRHSAESYLDAPIKRVDTILSPDTWLPYDRPGRFPAYRFYYDDAEATELYLSANTGEAIQTTNRHSRLWAYLGAIPHWIYPYQLRQHRDAWVWVISIISGLGVLMCLSGIIIGLRISWLGRKRKGLLHSPYKRYAYKWHHYLGLIFGFFATVFIFSGFMSVQTIPQWLVKTHSDKYELAGHQHFHLSDIGLPTILDKVIVMDELGDIKRLSWQNFGTMPYVKVSGTLGTKYYHIPLEGEELRTLELSEGEVRNFIEQLCKNDTYSIAMINSYDNYYIDRQGELPLPVYKVEVEDADRSSFYIDPKTAKYHYHSRNSRLLRTLYTGLHSWVFAPLVSIPWLWWGLIIVLLIGGWLLSGTSLVLALAYFRRVFRGKAK